MNESDAFFDHVPQPEVIKTVELVNAQRLRFLQGAVDAYLQNPGCNNGSRVTAIARLQWALDESKKGS